MSTLKNPSTDRPFISPAVGAVPLVEWGKLPRLEKEGGQAALSLELVDVPLRLRRLGPDEKLL